MDGGNENTRCSCEAARRPDCRHCVVRQHRARVRGGRDSQRNLWSGRMSAGALEIRLIGLARIEGAVPPPSVDLYDEDIPF